MHLIYSLATIIKDGQSLVSGRQSFLGSFLLDIGYDVVDEPKGCFLICPVVGRMPYIKVSWEPCIMRVWHPLSPFLSRVQFSPGTKLMPVWSQLKTSSPGIPCALTIPEISSKNFCRISSNSSLEGFPVLVKFFVWRSPFAGECNVTFILCYHWSVLRILSGEISPQTHGQTLLFSHCVKQHVQIPALKSLVSMVRVTI